MFAFANDATVYLHREPVDFRKQIDGLAILVQQSMELDPMQAALFVFTNKRRDRIRALWWDRNGFCLWTKRLEEDRFLWPIQSDREVVTLDGERLGWLLRGLDVFRMAPHPQRRYGAVS